MFGSKSKKAKTDAVAGFLGSQTEFTGKLSFSGVVHLDGRFEGEIFSRGTLVVGAESIINANIQSNVVKIAGEVNGDLTATEKIELYPPAKVTGNIRTPSLIVEEGASFDGTCKMSSTTEQIPRLTDTEPDTTEEDEEAEAIAAQAWPPPYEPAEGLDEDEEAGEQSLPKVDR
jgi:cytoskeletal protein CcmA (bactofilin family)